MIAVILALKLYIGNRFPDAFDGQRKDRPMISQNFLRFVTDYQNHDDGLHTKLAASH